MSYTPYKMQIRDQILFKKYHSRCHVSGGDLLTLLNVRCKGDLLKLLFSSYNIEVLVSGGAAFDLPEKKAIQSDSLIVGIVTESPFFVFVGDFCSITNLLFNFFVAAKTFAHLAKALMKQVNSYLILFLMLPISLL